MKDYNVSTSLMSRFSKVILRNAITIKLSQSALFGMMTYTC